MKGHSWVQRAIDFFFPPVPEARATSAKSPGMETATFEEKDNTICDLRSQIEDAIAKRDQTVTNGKRALSPWGEEAPTS